MTFQTEPRDHRFFGIVSLLAAIAILLGFGNTYGAKLVGGVPVVPGLIHIHALAFACWLILLIAQVELVRRGRIDLHRRLGVVGACSRRWCWPAGCFAAAPRRTSASC